MGHLLDEFSVLVDDDPITVACDKARALLQSLSGEAMEQEGVSDGFYSVGYEDGLRGATPRTFSLRSNRARYTKGYAAGFEARKG